MRVPENVQEIKLPRLSKTWDDGEIAELKGYKTLLRQFIDGTRTGPFSSYESRRFAQLEKKYKYHPDHLMW